jgi:hypothetical protein
MKKILEQLGMYRADDIKPLKKPREYSSALRHRRRRRPPSTPARPRVRRSLPLIHLSLLRELIFKSVRVSFQRRVDATLTRRPRRDNV